MTMQIERYQYLVPNTIEEEKNSLRDILGVLFRHKKTIALFFGVIVGAATLFTFLMPKTFQSEARVLLKVGRESVGMDPSVVGPTISISENRESELNSELSILKSRTVFDMALDKAGIANILGGKDVKAGDPGDRDKATKLIANSFKVDVENKSHIISMNFQARSPELAQAGLSAILNSYLEHHIEVYKNQASPKFFEQQVKALGDDLHKKEKELEAFRVKNGITSAEKQKDAILSLMSGLQKDMDDTYGQMSSSQARIASLEKSLQAHPEMRELARVDGRSNPAFDAMKSRLNELKMKEVDLKSRYKADSPALAPIKDQIGKAEAAISKEKATQSEVTMGLDANHQAIRLELDREKAQLKAAQARNQSLQEELGKRQQEMDRLTTLEVTERQLQRDVDTLNTEYTRYSENLQRSKITNAFEIDKVSNVSIVQAPTKPLTAIKPNKMLNIGLAMFMGLFGGIGLAFFIEFFDNTLRSNDDVEKRLGLPVLVAISSEEFEQCI